MAHDSDMERQIQQSLLPRGPLSAGHLTIRGDHRAATEVGGDYYDFLPLSDGRIAVAFADVAGRGLASCLVMSTLSTLLRALRNCHSSPAALLGELDERLGESLLPGVFVTMFYGILDPANGRMVFTSAGHNPMIIYRYAERLTDVLQPTGMPLAALRSGVGRTMFCDEIVQLGPGDVMVHFSDGYSDTLNAVHQEEYGLERIERVVAEAAPHGADAICERLSEEVRQWAGAGPPRDDQTLLIATLAVDARGPAFELTAPPGDPARPALERLAAAEREGQGLQLTAASDLIGVIREWLRRVPGLGELSHEDAHLLGLALYEVCTNIAEHGFGDAADHEFELWWQPSRSAAPSSLSEEEQARRGVFVVRDDGAPFRPENWSGLDFDDPAVRRRGRGFGLEIIHRVMNEVAYHPATARGNITLLTFGPRRATSIKEG